MSEATTRRNRTRSASGDVEDSDFESHAGDAHPPGKPGRKKNPNSQAARRDQNRIAQREFRLRKQQRIRDLEARVEILSGGHDEALGEARNMLQDLMAENQNLRTLLRSLAGFIGDGAGGLLNKIGWDLQDFTDYVNKSETDTAYEGYQRRKKVSQSGQSSESPSVLAPGQKRGAEGDLNGARKKSRSDDKDGDAGRTPFSMMMPLGASAPLYPGTRQQDGLFPSGSNGNSSLFMSPTSTGHPGTAQYPSAPGSNMDGYPRSFMPGVSVNMDQTMPSSYESSGAGGIIPPQQRLQAEAGATDEFEDEDPKKNEAMKLIHYHLENYKRNSSYCLPASLRPTIVQRTIPHESVIDRVLHPELRDRMILLRQRFELVDCLMDFRAAVTIHGDDVLSHNNWELGEKFIRKYSFLVDAPLLKLVNRWRRERGDAEIVLGEVNGEALNGI